MKIGQHTDIGSLDHAHVFPAITNTTNAPFGEFLIRRATSAFCVGEHRQATTAESLVGMSTNSFLNKVRQSCRAGK